MRVLAWNADRVYRIIYPDITIRSIRVWQVIPSSCKQVSVLPLFFSFISPFLQPHVAWHWVFLPRLENLLKSNTGFMSFGPYINQTCGVDSSSQSFPRMADIYSAFRSDLCPPIPQLVSLFAFVFRLC